MEIAPLVLHDSKGSFGFPQQKATEPSTRSRKEILVTTVGARNIHTNVPGVTLVRGVQDLVRIPD